MTEDERLGSLVAIYQNNFGPVAETIWDCGSRDGDDAAYLAEKLFAKRVICIDANPVAIEQIKRRHPYFKVIHTAITDYDGVTKFDMIESKRPDYAGSSSIVRTQEFPDASYRTITVSANRMDTIISKNEPIGLDLMKVDLEGFTYEFLESMGNYLPRVKVLHLETEKFDRHEGHKDSAAVSTFMDTAGFKLAEVSYEWGPSIEDQIWINPNLR